MQLIKLSLTSTFILSLVCAPVAHAVVASPPAVDEITRDEAREVAALRRTDLRLRILLAQAALIDVRKNQWILDHLGTSKHPSVRNWVLGVGSMVLDALVLSHSIHFLTDESRVSFHREVRRMYREVNAANSRLLDLSAQMYGRGRLGPSPVRSPEVMAALADAESEVARLTTARSALVAGLPWQRVARAVRVPIALGLGAYLIADPLLTYMQVSLDPAVGEVIGDRLSAFIMEAQETLAAKGDLE